MKKTAQMAEGSQWEKKGRTVDFVKTWDNGVIHSVKTNDIMHISREWYWKLVKINSKGCFISHGQATILVGLLIILLVYPS